MAKQPPKSTKKPAPKKQAPKPRATTKKPTTKKAPAKPAQAKKAGAKPKLLSGGNPQIAKADGDAPVQAFIDAMPGWKRDVGRQLDAIIGRTLPGVRRAVRWNSPFYGTEANGWFLSYHCITRYIKVAFFRGTELDPMPPVASKNEGTRYFHIHEGEAIDEKLFASWVRQGAKLPGWDGFKC
ncbi:MAG: DUF1801 domain-containing protein [Phycisphaerales bacterium]|nr:DUF1801 domain-containing protein [Phycisphaerales bacterium]